MLYKIITLGCKVNSYESDHIKEKFNEVGYLENNTDKPSDIVVVNTCSVTNQSDAKSRQMIRQAKRANPDAVLVVCGCSSQNHQEELNELGIDILLGNKDKSKIVEYVQEFLKSKQTITKFYDMKMQEFETMFIKNETDKTRAFVKIQDGCNNFCSYCIIPYLRGTIRSKDIEIAYEEIKSLVNMGHSEIVLTGIHTGSYGRGKNYDLVDLIRKISELENLKRIRISSIEITELNEKFMDELKNNSKICNHLHVPLQSGSDAILKLMNRKYDKEYYKNKINKIRSIRPDISITTDLIIGFPGETEELFNETYEFLQVINFTKIHTFPFSLRSGTKAESMMDNKVPDNMKKEHVKRVLELSNKLEHNYYQKFIGKELDIIAENSKDDYSQGHTSNYILVHTDKKLNEGEIVNVQIMEVDGLKVKGEVL